MARRVLFQPTDRSVDGGGPGQAVADRPAATGEVELDAIELNSAPSQPALLGVPEGEVPALAQIEAGSDFSTRLRQFAYSCGERSIGYLVENKYLGSEDGEGILSSFGYYVNDLPEKSSILDIIAFLVWIKLESKDEKAVKEIRNLTELLKKGTTEKIGHMGFAHLNETPGNLYHGHPRVHEICSTMMCPVIQNNEADFVTVTSVNPITACTAGAAISAELERATGTKPFITVLTTDSSAWSFLCEKHFGS